MLPYMPSLRALLCILSLRMTIAQASPIEFEQSITLPLLPRQTTHPCPAGLHIISAPGRGSKTLNGRLQPLINALKLSIPSSTAITVIYNETSVMINTARPLVLSYITSFLAACPNTPIMMLGYSIGAVIMMDSLCGASERFVAPSGQLDASYARHIVASVFYGEETFRSGMSYSRGTCRKDAPIFPRRRPQDCAPFAANMRDYCNADDGECCAGGSDDIATHYVYPDMYDDHALDFVVGRYWDYRTAQMELLGSSNGTIDT